MREGKYMSQEFKQIDYSKDINPEGNFLVELCRALNTIDMRPISMVEYTLVNAMRGNHSVFICGNGGSAGNASHFVCDLFKIARMRAICLNDNPSLTTAIINENGWENLYVNQLKRLFKKGDVLIVLSVHGGIGKDKAELWSQNLLKAVNYVNVNGGITIGFSGCNGGAFKEHCQINIIVESSSTPVVESLHCTIAHLITNSIAVRHNDDADD
jgi:D-sedoheptulose 7-phosphate isomerase